MIKKVIKKSKDRVFSRVYESIAEIRIMVASVEERQHAQTHKLNLINDRLNNSGVVRISDSEVLTKIFTGLKMYLDPRDISVTPHLIFDGVWEQNVSTAWLSLLSATDTVVDIGANFGYFGLLAGQRTDRKKSKVIFFEANPHLIPYIRKNLAVNWLNEQSVIVNTALSDKKGKVKLNVLKDYIGSSSIVPIKNIDKFMHEKMYLESEESIEVESCTLDDYCKRAGIKKIDLIKMDIEGFEETAYKGMRKIVESSPRATMFLEFTKQSYDNPEKFYEQLLKDFGSVYLIDEDGKITKPKDTTYKNVIDSTDSWVMPIFSKRSNLHDAGQQK